jgi:hypothetical protein
MTAPTPTPTPTPLTPTQARAALRQLRWVATHTHRELVDDETVYGIAVDRAEAEQIEAEVRALLEAVAATEVDR